MRMPIRMLLFAAAFAHAGACNTEDHGDPSDPPQEMPEPEDEFGAAEHNEPGVEDEAEEPADEKADDEPQAPAPAPEAKAQPAAPSAEPDTKAQPAAEEAEPAPAAEAKPAAPAKVAEPCGEKGQPSCPLQGFMETKVDAVLERGELAAVAGALEKVAGWSPDPSWNSGDTSWSSFAKTGAKAARDGDGSALEQSCKGCHRAWRKKYKADHRTRAIPGG